MRLPAKMVNKRKVKSLKNVVFLRLLDDGAYDGKVELCSQNTNKGEHLKFTLPLKRISGIRKSEAVKFLPRRKQNANFKLIFASESGFCVLIIRTNEKLTEKISVNFDTILVFRVCFF